MPFSDPFNLQRFVEAQAGVFETVLLEIRQGAKQSHWMWFIFPQLAELGRSSTAKFYGLTSLKEASAYLEHPLLGPRLESCIEALLGSSNDRSAEQIFGVIDAVKLRSSLTLFDRVRPLQLFDQALLNFFGGARDERTLALLDREQ